jgi:hypothetical protein
MPDLNELKTRLLADGRIDDDEVAVIRKELYADGNIDREEVEFLMAIRESAQGVCPAFEELFFAALKQHVLTDGSIDADEANWLRKTLFADGKIDDSQRHRHHREEEPPRKTRKTRKKADKTASVLWLLLFRVFRVFRGWTLLLGVLLCVLCDSVVRNSCCLARKSFEPPPSVCYR